MELLFSSIISVYYRLNIWAVDLIPSNCYTQTLALTHCISISELVCSILSIFSLVSQEISKPTGILVVGRSNCSQIISSPPLACCRRGEVCDSVCQRDASHLRLQGPQPALVELTLWPGEVHHLGWRLKRSCCTSEPSRGRSKEGCVFSIWLQGNHGG